MEGAYVVVYLGVALASLLIVLASRRRWGASGDGLRLPPGPWQLPVIGSLHHLVLSGQLPHRALRDLARRHGPAMMLRLGEVNALVVSSQEGAREVMKTHDTTFATRPLSATMRVLSSGGRDIVFAPYGDYWRQLRKIAVAELFTARRVLSFRAIREEEVAAALRAVGEAAAAKRPVEMRALLSALVTDSTVRAVMGDRCRERDAFHRALDRTLQLAAGFNPADMWPSSRLAAWFSGAEEVRRNLYGILDGIVKEHLERMDDGGGHAEDLLDVLLRIQKEGALQFPLHIDAVKSVILEKAQNSITAGNRESRQPMRNCFGGTNFTFLPFGAGRRMCPGMAFGLAGVELPLANLLFHFDWEQADQGSAELDMTETFGLTAARKEQLLLSPFLRVPIPEV